MNASISPATIPTLSSGEFVGVLGDDPDRRTRLKAFHATIVKEGIGTSLEELPIVREVTEAMVRENFMRVKREVSELVECETKRIAGDPALKDGIIK